MSALFLLCWKLNDLTSKYFGDSAHPLDINGVIRRVSRFCTQVCTRALVCTRLRLPLWWGALVWASAVIMSSWGWSRKLSLCFCQHKYVRQEYLGSGARISLPINLTGRFCFSFLSKMARRTTPGLKDGNVWFEMGREAEVGVDMSLTEWEEIGTAIRITNVKGLKRRHEREARMKTLFYLGFLELYLRSCRVPTKDVQQVQKHHNFLIRVYMSDIEMAGEKPGESEQRQNMWQTPNHTSLHPQKSFFQFSEQFLQFLLVLSCYLFS